MSSFLNLLSTKKGPASPRPNIPDEKDGDEAASLAPSSNSSARHRSKSKSKIKIPDDVPDASSSNEAEGEDVILRSDDARTGDKDDVADAEEVEETVDEDVKPFDASTSLLVFHTGQVYVREDREVVVEKGGQAVIRDLPASIQPNSLHFHSHTDTDASIVEQTFENGTESILALLAESVGQTVVLKLPREQGLTGKLFRVTDTDVVLETEEGAVVSVLRSQVIAAEVNHQTFNKEPALHCIVETNNEGAHKAQLTYEASGIIWSAEYTLVLRSNTEAQFTGWLTLENRSGKSFTDSALALVAAPTLQYDSMESPRNNKMKAKNIISSLSSFNKKRSVKPKSTQNTSFLPRPVSLVDGKTKQVRIAHATFPVEQINLFRKFTSPFTGEYGGPHTNHALEGYKSVDKVIRWINSKNTHPRLGVELTAGNIDVIESVKGDTFLNLRHQDQLPFTRPNAEILLATGAHPTLRGERKVSELKHDAKTRTIREVVQIEIKNDGRSKEEVVVEDALWRWRNFTVSPCQPKYDDIARPKQVMTWRLMVRPKSTEVIRYTVLYSDVPQ